VVVLANVRAMESDEDTETESEDNTDVKGHQPMNAFLLFCKQHRQIVREKYPAIKNRSITKLLEEWWSSLAEDEKSPYTDLSIQYKEAFMKANPEFRWHKMPPGSADSLPPSNAKPSTPSPANGLTCSMASSLLTTASMSPTLSSSQDNVITSSSACAPKPFKKRYLASQLATMEPSRDPVSQLSEGVSPEAARACEALMELARNESGSRSSEGSERRASPSDTPPLQTLREAVWSKVAGTLLKQEEEKLVVPPKDCPMNLTNQCTIRGQQIIEHIIENILSIPMNGPLDPTSEPITFSVNNNQERSEQPHVRQCPPCPPCTQSNGDVGDSIKASIYESLKNDLLKGKVTPILPVTTSRSHSVTPKSSHSSSPTVSPISVRQKTTAKKQQQEACTVVSSSPTGQDVLRLLGAGQLPINVGNSAITITKTPRATSLASTPSSTAPSFPVTCTTTMSSSTSSSSSPVSLSLTRTGGGPTARGFPASFSLSGSVPVLLSPQSGLVLSSPGMLLSSRQGPGDCVLLSPLQHLPGSQVVLGPSSPHLLLAGTKLVLAPQSSPPPPAPGPSPDPVNLSVSSGPRVASNEPAPKPREATATKRPLQPENIGEERRSSRTGRGRRYQEFIEDISNTKKKRRSHRSGEELSEPELELEPLHTLPNEELSSSPLVTAAAPTPQHVHWKKMRTASLGTRDNTPASEAPSPSSPSQQASLANQETSTTANPQFDLDAKMEKMEPLKFPDSFGKGKGIPSSSTAKPTSSSNRCNTRQNQQQDRTTANLSKAFDSRLNKKSR